MSQLPHPQFNTYDCIVRCIAMQLRQSDSVLADGTIAMDIAMESLPRDFWEYFCTLPYNDNHTIEVLDNLTLELEKKAGKVSATLKLKMVGAPMVIIAKW